MGDPKFSQDVREEWFRVLAESSARIREGAEAVLRIPKMTRVRIAAAMGVSTRTFKKFWDGEMSPPRAKAARLVAFLRENGYDGVTVEEISPEPIPGLPDGFRLAWEGHWPFNPCNLSPTRPDPDAAEQALNEYVPRRVKAAVNGWLTTLDRDADWDVDGLLRDVNGPRTLWWSVLEQGLVDISQQNLTQELAEWVRAPAGQVGSLRFCCDATGIDAEVILRRLYAVRKGQCTFRVKRTSKNESKRIYADHELA